VRLVFFGTPEPAVPSLEAIVAAGHDVALVVSQPDRAAGRSRTPSAPPVKRAAERHGIAVVQPERLGAPEFLDTVRASGGALFVVVAYGRLLRPRLLDLAPAGAINLHFSLLPRYRGAAPVQWALARGETRTGVTTMRISERLDEGAILLQREVAIEPREHAPALSARLARIGADLLVETIAGLAAGRLAGQAQNDAEATFAPLLSVADGEFDPRMPAADVVGRIRGFDPWPGVWARREGTRVRLVEAEASAARSEEPPGTLIDLGAGEVGLVCGGGTVLRLARVQFEGRRATSVREAIVGRQLRVADVVLGR
jgi:methionyl-tRNA formyltransferase